MISWMLLAGAVSTSSTLMPCRALRLAVCGINVVSK